MREVLGAICCVITLVSILYFVVVSFEEENVTSLCIPCALFFGSISYYLMN